MLYVLILEILGDRRGKVYGSAEHANVCYSEAVRVCMDGPDEDDVTTPYLISNCWLYAADTTDDSAALSDAMAGRAVLLSAFFEG